MLAVIGVAAVLFVIGPAFLTFCAAYAFGLRDPRVLMLTFAVMAWGLWKVVQGPEQPAPQVVATHPAR